MDSFRKNHRKTKNSTTLADLKNVKNEKHRNNGNTQPTMQPKHHSVLLVKTTSDATLDDASIGLTQEQPEERIGSEKDRR